VKCQREISYLLKKFLGVMSDATPTLYLLLGEVKLLLSPAKIISRERKKGSLPTYVAPWMIVQMTLISNIISYKSKLLVLVIHQ